MDIGPTPIDWYKSSQIRVAALLLLSPIVRVLQHTKLGALTHIDWMGSDVHEIADTILSAIVGGGAIFWTVKRVVAGKAVGSPAPPIKPPAVVAVVKRLTSG